VEQPVLLQEAGLTGDAAPSNGVLAAFGARDAPVALPGGSTTAYAASGLVFKRGQDDNFTAWLAEVSHVVERETAFRFARPVRSISGSWTVEGWSASTQLAGRHEPGRWTDILSVGRALHRAVAGMPCPPFQAARTDQWALGDRAAWGECEVAVPALLQEQVSSTAALLRPIELPSQLVHGDLCGNVLFAPALPPALLDFSPYFRPAEYAEAILVADAIVWEGASAELVGALRRDTAGQMLVRASLFRLYTAAVAWPGKPQRLTTIAEQHKQFTRLLQTLVDPH